MGDFLVTCVIEYNDPFSRRMVSCLLVLLSEILSKLICDRYVFLILLGSVSEFERLTRV